MANINSYENRPELQKTMANNPNTN